MYKIIIILKNYYNQSKIKLFYTFFNKILLKYTNKKYLNLIKYVTN